MTSPAATSASGPAAVPLGGRSRPLLPSGVIPVPVPCSPRASSPAPAGTGGGPTSAPPEPESLAWPSDARQARDCPRGTEVGPSMPRGACWDTATPDRSLSWLEMLLEVLAVTAPEAEF